MGQAVALCKSGVPSVPPSVTLSSKSMKPRRAFVFVQDRLKNRNFLPTVNSSVSSTVVTRQSVC